MQFDFNFYSSLLLITFSNGFIYSVLLLKKAIKNSSQPDYWLSLFVFLCALFVAPWMLGFAGWYDNQPYRNIMFYTPFQHLFFIGPVIYFYTQSLLNPAFKFKRQQILHLIPGVFYIIYIFVMFVYDNFISKTIYFYAEGMDKDFDLWFQISGQISMILYFLLSLKYYNNYRKLIVQITSNADALLFKWIKKYLIAFLIMIISPLFFKIINNYFPQENGYQDSWWFYLFYSIVLYYIAVTGYSNAIEAKIGYKFTFSDNNLQYSLVENQNINIDDETSFNLDFESEKSIISPEIKAMTTKIETLIQTGKLYENPELSLTEISKKLESNSSIISKAINQGFGMNFNDFINNYRIEAVKKMFDNGLHKKSTLLGIAYDCGFNSKATFNRAFKKNTGFSPKEYLSKT